MSPVPGAEEPQVPVWPAPAAPAQSLQLPKPPVQISLCPSGPLLVRGLIELVDSDGAVLPTNRATIALCRCGKTLIAPFCDGTHKLIRQRADRAARRGADHGDSH